jgi:hypothetical protein
MFKLFSTAYGSKLYGTQTPTSDTDIKHIVLPALDTLLLGRKVENKVKQTNKEANTKNGVDDIDEEFIPIQIFARHFIEGQTYAIELAFALEGTHAGQTVYDPRGKVIKCNISNSELNPIYEEKVMIIDEMWNDRVALAKPYIITFIQELREKFLTSNIKAMMGYVVNQASLYSFKGERLNATRELISIVSSLKQTNPTLDEEKATLFNCYTGSSEFSLAADQLAEKYPKYFRKDQYDVGAGQMKPCFVILEKTLPFTNSIEQTLKVLNSLKNKYGSRVDQASETNVDWKATMHAIRIVDEGLHLLAERKLKFPLDKEYVEHLLAVKRGELPLDPIKEELAEKLELLKELEMNTTLPACTPELMKELDAWISGWMRKFYNLK